MERFRAAALTAGLVALWSAQGVAASKPYCRQPAISRDGAIVAFVCGGDIYEVASKGGRARVRVRDDAYDSCPRFSPDSQWLAFTSTRTGNGDVYVMDRGTGELRRLTWHDAADLVEGWSPDSRFVYFSSSRHDISGNADIFRIALDGSTPVPMSRDRYEEEYNAAVSPDGRTLAFNSNDRVRQWWRKGLRVSDATEIWLKSNEPSALDYRRLTSYAGKDSWPMWAPDGKGVYFVTDEGSADGSENLAYQSLDGRRERVTHFDSGRVLWPDLAADGTIVFERDFQLWRWRPGQTPRSIAISLETLPSEAPEPEVPVDKVTEFALSHDGQSIAVVAHGDLFTAPTDSIGTIRRITRTPAPEAGVAWAPDDRSLVYSSLRGGYHDVYRLDLATGREEQLTRDHTSNLDPRISPDGRWLAYARGTEGLAVIDLTKHAQPRLLDGVMLVPRFAWSPDSRRLAYFDSDAKWFSNVFVVDVGAEQPAPAQMSFLADSFFDELLWAPDASFIVFDSRHERGECRIFAIDLPPPSSGSIQDHRGDPAGIPAMRNRTQAIGPRGAELEALSADGTQLIFTQPLADRTSLWIAHVGSDELSDMQELASGHEFSNVRFRDDHTVLYLSDGKIQRLDIATRTIEEFPIQVDLSDDPSATRVALFREAWTILRDYTGDPTFNGLDWEAAYRKHLPYIQGVTNDEDFQHVFNLMIGDLDTSHVGIRMNSPETGVAVADLGIDFDPQVLDHSGTYRVSEAIPRGPVDLAGGPALRGAFLRSIDGVELDSSSNINHLLEGKVGKTIVLEFDDSEDSTHRTTLTLQGAANRLVNKLRYEQWVAWNAAYVDSLSRGRLGYLHRRHFGTGALEEMKLQLGSDVLAKDGLIIDIRHNGGGWASSLVAELLSRPATHRSSFQGRVTTANAIIHGVTVIDLPTALLQNEQCLSDAENFSETYRCMRLGKIVGMPTAAWNAGARSYRLFDGSTVSVPAWTTFAATGEDMNRSPRLPDVTVDRPIGQGLTGRDDQLQEVVRVLLSQIDGE